MVERVPGELLSAYVAHFKDLEMRMVCAKLKCQEGQLRAFKLLRSSRLSPEVRRNFLLATGNESDFDKLASAMSIQWLTTAPNWVAPLKRQSRKRAVDSRQGSRRQPSAGGKGAPG